MSSCVDVVWSRRFLRRPQKRDARRSKRVPSVLAFAPVFAWLLIYSTQPRVVRGVDQRTLPRVDGALLPGVTRALACEARPSLDVLAASVYAAHFVIPFATPVALYATRGAGAVERFAWRFGTVNVAAVVLQLAWPTAPPWYEGDGAERVAGSAAGLSRVDAMIGAPLFGTLYARSKIVFGAFPSLHAAWPLLLAVAVGGRAGLAWGALHTAWVSWAAVYLRHHYAVDAVGGWALVLLVVCRVPCPRGLREQRQPDDPPDLESGESVMDFVEEEEEPKAL